MENIINEMFLSEYFFMQAILGKFLDDERTLFFKLGDLFYLTNEQLENLYNLACEDGVKNVASEKDFALSQRINKYAEITGITIKCANDEMITIKGNAIKRAANLQLSNSGAISRNILYNALATKADCGCVDALRTLGILRCEGLFIDKNIEAGLANLSKGADWNDVKSLIALLHYTKNSFEYNLSRLYMLVHDEPFACLYQSAAAAKEGFRPKEIKETKLLRKAFNASVLSRDTYGPKYARVIYSNAISLQDKEKAVFYPGKEVIAAIADLPLKVAKADGVKVNLADLGNMPLTRKAECEKIAVNLAFNTTSSLYRPLCLCSDSDYLLSMYSHALSNQSEGVNVEHIKINELVGYDLEPSANNIFIRSIDEDKFNIFLIYIEGNVQEGALDVAKAFLQSGKRAKFHLGAPNVNINLSHVLPIVLSDKRNGEKLSDICDVVELARVTQKEMATIVDEIIANRQTAYNIQKITLSDDALPCFNDMSVDEVEKCLDKAIRVEALKSSNLQLSKEVLTPYIREQRTSGMGFGGDV